jgi:hypothetical protein
MIVLLVSSIVARGHGQIEGRYGILSASVFSAGTRWIPCRFSARDAPRHLLAIRIGREIAKRRQRQEFHLVPGSVVVGPLLLAPAAGSPLPGAVKPVALTQHRTLLSLPDPERKEELARRALSEGWPSQILAEEVSKLLPKSRRGRKPSPHFVKAIRRVAKALERPFTEELTDDEIFRLGPEQAAVLIAKIEENLNRLETLRRTLAETRIRLWPDES